MLNMLLCTQGLGQTFHVPNLMQMNANKELTLGSAHEKLDVWRGLNDCPYHADGKILQFWLFNEYINFPNTLNLSPYG